MKNLLQPASDVGIIAGFNMTREESAFELRVVIKPTHSRDYQTCHVLRPRGQSLAAILRVIQLPDQLHRLPQRQGSVPEFYRDSTRAGRHSRAIHETKRGMQANDYHRTGRGWVES